LKRTLGASYETSSSLKTRNAIRPTDLDYSRCRRDDRPNGESLSTKESGQHGDSAKAAPVPDQAQAHQPI
jgi:hypothetical protein